MEIHWHGSARGVNREKKKKLTESQRGKNCFSSWNERFEDLAGGPIPDYIFLQGILSGQRMLEAGEVSILWCHFGNTDMKFTLQQVRDNLRDENQFRERGSEAKVKAPWRTNLDTNLEFLI